MLLCQITRNPSLPCQVTRNPLEHHHICQFKSNSRSSITLNLCVITYLTPHQRQINGRCCFKTYCIDKIQASLYDIWNESVRCNHVLWRRTNKLTM